METYNPKESVGFLIYDISRLLRQDFHIRFEPLGLTQAQWRALAHIARMEGCSQATLAEVLEIKPITLSRQLDRLQEAAWIERRPDPTDRRAVQLFLTEHAKPVIQQMKELALETRTRAMAGLTEQEQEQLAQLLHRVKANLCQK